MAITRKTNIEQALKIASEHKTELFRKDVNEELSDVVQFVLALDIRAGKIKVKTKLIYDAYVLWSKEPISKKSFSEEFSKMFIAKQTSRMYFYQLNYYPTELLKEATK